MVELVRCFMTDCTVISPQQWGVVDADGVGNRWIGNRFEMDSEPEGSDHGVILIDGQGEQDQGVVVSRNTLVFAPSLARPWAAGVFIKRASGTTVSHNTVIAADTAGVADGIRVLDSSNMRIAGNEIVNHSRDGIAIEGGGGWQPRSIRIERNKMNDSVHDIRIVGDQKAIEDVHIEGNESHRASAAELLISPGAPTTYSPNLTGDFATDVNQTNMFDTVSVSP